MQPQQETLLNEFELLLDKTKQKRTLSNQNYNSNYYHDVFIPLLQLGQYHEDKTILRIIKHFNWDKPNIIRCNTNEYDIMINNIKFEVKTDIKAVETSNIFIEFIQKNKPSGIITTKSEYYVFVIPYKIPLYLMIEVLEIEFLITTQQYQRISQPSVYNNFTGGYIFDIQTIIKGSILI